METDISVWFPAMNHRLHDIRFNPCPRAQFCAQRGIPKSHTKKWPFNILVISVDLPNIAPNTANRNLLEACKKKCNMYGCVRTILTRGYSRLIYLCAPLLKENYQHTRVINPPQKFHGKWRYRGQKKVPTKVLLKIWAGLCEDAWKIWRNLEKVFEQLFENSGGIRMDKLCKKHYCNHFYEAYRNL